MPVVRLSSITNFATRSIEAMDSVCREFGKGEKWGGSAGSSLVSIAMISIGLGGVGDRWSMMIGFTVGVGSM